MKLLYVATHQIHNLTPLFRELNLKDKIDFKAIYWQKISSNYYDPEFNTKVNFAVNQFSGYEYFCLFDKEKSTYDLSFFFKLKVIPKIIKLILKEDFAAIVFHSYLFPNVIASIVAKLIGKKTIIRSMSYNLGKRSFIKNIIRNIYYRFSNLFIDQYWTIHKLNEDFFVNFGAKKENLFFIDHCQGEYKKLLKKDSSILISKDEFCKKHDLPKEKKFIFFAGRFNKRKNPKLLFEAFIDANLSDDWFLIMAGDGKFKNEIKTSAENKKIKNLQFLGFQNQSSIISFFQHSEILVLPSGWGDTNGNIASEAIQFGCALIISNMVGHYPEFVKEEVGLVFDFEKKEELINRLKLFTSDSKILNKYQKNALEYGKKKTPEHSANLIVKALDL